MATILQFALQSCHLLLVTGLATTYRVLDQIVGNPWEHAERSVIAATPTIRPTFMSQYGPVLAACIALAGAMITLIISGRREERRHRTAKVDDYRREQLLAIATIANAAHDYRRHATAAGAPTRLLSESEEAALALREAAEQASSDLLNALTVAGLLVHDGPLQAALDALLECWTTSSSKLATLFEAFPARRVSDIAEAARDLASYWPDFMDAAVHLQETARTRLAPTIITLDAKGSCAGTEVDQY